MCTHLVNRSGTYYFRRVIPRDLQPHFDGAAQWMFSLRTKDFETGKRLARAEGVRTDGLIENARAAMAAGSNSAPVPDLSASPGRAMTQFEIEQMEAGEADAAERSHRRRRRRTRREQIEAMMRLSTAEIPEDVAAMRDILRDREYDLEIERGHRIAAQVELREARLFVPPAPEPESKATGAADWLDTDVIDRWAKERTVRAKGIDTHRRVAQWFYARVGRKPVAAIGRKDVIDFKDALVAEGQSSANIRVKLSRLRTLLQYAFENDMAPINAADGVRIRDAQSGRNRRVPFDLAALNRIFASPVYATGARPTQGRGEAAYWLPLLALFTGARLEEIGQLRPSDVLEMAYHDDEGIERLGWFLRITEDAEEGLHIKNAGSERVVPLHSELERLGFLSFVEAMRKAKRARLFHDLRPDKYGRHTAKWGEWWSGYRRNDCGITDRRMVFHSFRHTFKHYAGHVGILEGVQRQIMGHSPGDVADEYRGNYTPFQLVEGMAKFRIAGLKLPTPNS